MMTTFSTPRRVHDRLLRWSTALVVMALPLAGCGPIPFESSSPFVIAGDPPPPPPKPKPKPKPKLVEIQDNKIVIRDKIHFEFAKAKIQEDESTLKLLNEIVVVIKEHPHIKKISIEGHTSSEGSDRYNKKLSDKRATAVKHWLVDHEINADKLVSKGWGEERPIEDESSEAGKEANRRVEFIILEQDVTKKKVERDPETGEEKVLEEKTETETR